MLPLRHLFDKRIFRKLRLFLLWLVVFYTLWAAVMTFGNHWAEAREHWGIAVAMAAGSYFAGSTPMGGGTVGFPVLVLLFDEEAALGRNFALAVQSAGMVSAAIFIFVTRRPLAWRFVGWACAGALVATPLCAAFVAPVVPGFFAKLLFAVVWASFGLLHFLRVREFVKSHGMGAHTPALDARVGLLVGVLGGLVASITGVGIDMLLYAALVLLFRTDLKIAIPSSVIAMAFTSVVGFLANLLLGNIQPEVYANLYAAAPVVVIGAPFGALVIHFMPRTPTLLLVSVLCVGQFVWTCVDQHVTGMALAGAVGGVAVCAALFQLVHMWGDRIRLRETR